MGVRIRRWERRSLAGVVKSERDRHGGGVCHAERHIFFCTKLRCEHVLR